MKTKHIQGPWEVADFISKTDQSRHLAVWKGHERPICLVSPKENEDQEDLANARLIAAAPEMLEGCKAAIAIFQSQGIDESHHIVGDVFAKITGAIKKATE